MQKHRKRQPRKTNTKKYHPPLAWRPQKITPELRGKTTLARALGLLPSWDVIRRVYELSDIYLPHSMDDSIRGWEKYHHTMRNCVGDLCIGFVGTRAFLLKLWTDPTKISDFYYRTVRELGVAFPNIKCTIIHIRISKFTDLLTLCRRDHLYNSDLDGIPHWAYDELCVIRVEDWFKRNDWTRQRV